MTEYKSFSEVLVAIKRGATASRQGWNERGPCIVAQFPDEHSKMTLPYIYIEYPLDHLMYPGARHPWVASQTDLMMEDWKIYWD